MSFELQDLKKNANEPATDVNGGGGGGRHDTPDSWLLPGAQTNGHHGENMSSGPISDEESCVHRQLCRGKYGKAKVWMVPPLMAFVAVVLVLISLALCAGLYADPDDTFESSTFVAARRFNGSLGLLFHDTPPANSSPGELAGHLQRKLSSVYTSSPALGRYFSQVEILALRNGSSIAEYQLTFALPEEQDEPLDKFTLSREMVYNVLRQSLHEQKLLPGQNQSALYMEPASLELS
ncbi:TPA-induced transmembrane protein [Stigmatopora nigra]